MLPNRLRLSLYAANAAAAATLIRSVFYDRWVTVVAAAILMTAAGAALRGKTWGIGVALGAAISFPVAWAIGIAPFWFCAVGVIGALPFFLTSKAIAKFDLAAGAIGAVAAAIVGSASAIGFRAIAPYLFTEFPSLRPSYEANHFGLACALMAIGTLVLARRAFPRDAATASAGNLASASAEGHSRIARRVIDESARTTSDTFEDALGADDESIGKTARS